MNWNPKHIVPACRNDCHICGHAGLQEEFRIGYVHDDVVGRDVLDTDRDLAYLPYGPLEHAVRECVNAEVRSFSVSQIADIRFAHVGIDLHLRQVLGDQKQRRRLKAGGDGLADVDIARDHRAVNRRDDVGIVEIDLRLLEVGLLLLDHRAVKRNLRCCLLVCTARIVEGVLRDNVFGHQLAVAVEKELFVGQVRLVFGEL